MRTMGRQSAVVIPVLTPGPVWANGIRISPSNEPCGWQVTIYRLQPGTGKRTSISISLDGALATLLAQVLTLQ